MEHLQALAFQFVFMDLENLQQRFVHEIYSSLFASDPFSNYFMQSVVTY